SRCTPGGDGARCVCSASAVPEPSVTFDLPSRNVTVTEGHRDYTVTTPGQGTGGVVTVTGILTLRGTLDPRLAVLCSAHNPHGTVRQQLRFHHPGLVWAKVGPVGAVVAFAIVIALVCYLSQSRRKPRPSPRARPRPSVGHAPEGHTLRSHAHLDATPPTPPRGPREATPLGEPTPPGSPRPLGDHAHERPRPIYRPRPPWRPRPQGATPPERGPIPGEATPDG
uniref:SMP protein n=1 Tax=Accipiter nisus TaxID=211598 RepID=A0A8B9N366_9AVES